MFIKLVRIGKDAELRFLQDQTPVINLPCVYDVGFGAKKRSQWIDVAIFGKQASALAPYLLKGNQVVINADDVEIEVFTKNDGTQGFKLKCRAVNITLCDSKKSEPQQSQQAPAQQAPMTRHVTHAPQQYQDKNGFSDDGFDDIPFN